MNMLLFEMIKKGNVGDLSSPSALIITESSTLSTTGIEIKLLSAAGHMLRFSSLKRSNNRDTLKNTDKTEHELS